MVYDSTIQLLQHFLELQIKMNTPFPVYKTELSPEANAFNAGVHYGLSQVLQVLNSFRSAEELSDYLTSLSEAVSEQSQF